MTGWAWGGMSNVRPRILTLSAKRYAMVPLSRLGSMTSVRLKATELVGQIGAVAHFSFNQTER